MKTGSPQERGSAGCKPTVAPIIESEEESGMDAESPDGKQPRLSVLEMSMWRWGGTG